MLPGWFDGHGLSSCNMNQPHAIEAPSNDTAVSRSGGQTAALVVAPLIVIGMGAAGVLWTGGWFSKWESIVLLSGGVGLLSNSLSAWKNQKYIPESQKWRIAPVIMALLVMILFMVFGFWALQKVQGGQGVLARANGNLDAILPICVAMINLASKHNTLLGRKHTEEP